MYKWYIYALHQNYGDKVNIAEFCLVVFKKIMYNKQLFEYNLNVYSIYYIT